MNRLIIDGSVLEGGGQVLRNSISLSALLQKHVSIYNIRKGRESPGLKNQHRTGLELAARIASAQLTGALNGSTDVEFIPGEINVPGDYVADSVTAGSTTLLLQISFPILLFARTEVEASTLRLLGGTNAGMAPQVDYMQHIFFPFFRGHFGVPANNISLDIVKRGYYPKGGGEILVKVLPFFGEQKLKNISLMERGDVKFIGGIAHYAKLPAAVGKGMVRGAKLALEKAGLFDKHDRAPPADSGDKTILPIVISDMCESDPLATGAGSGIVLWAQLGGGGIIGGSAVGRNNKRPENVGAEAAEELILGLENGGCLDEYLQDQIILFMALAEGQSEVNCGKAELALHTRTAIWAAQQLTNAKFDIARDESGNTIIRCKGIGYTAHQ